MRNFLLYIGLILAAIIIGVFLLSSNNQKTQETITQNQEASSSAMQKKQYNSPPIMSIDQNKKYTAKVTTSQGTFTIELFANEVPQTVNNFVFLAKVGFYDGTIFHRIVKDFMIQGGDPKGDGTGGPGYKFADEKITRDYKKGIVAMANSGPNTNGSQFFVMHKDTPLPKQYVIFGAVINGLETIDKIADTPTVDNGYGEKSKPTTPVTVEKVEITES